VCCRAAQRTICNLSCVSQAYNDANFPEELKYVKNSAGIAISDKEFNRLTELINNQDVKSILVFPIDGNPEATATKVKSLTVEITQKP
jgi:hypothetical protein